MYTLLFFNDGCTYTNIYGCAIVVVNYDVMKAIVAEDLDLDEIMNLDGAYLVTRFGE